MWRWISSARCHSSAFFPPALSWNKRACGLVRCTADASDEQGCIVACMPGGLEETFLHASACGNEAYRVGWVARGGVPRSGFAALALEMGEGFPILPVFVENAEVSAPTNNSLHQIPIHWGLSGPLGACRACVRVSACRQTGGRCWCVWRREGAAADFAQVAGLGGCCCDELDVEVKDVTGGAGDAVEPPVRFLDAATARCCIWMARETLAPFRREAPVGGS